MYYFIHSMNSVFAISFARHKNRYNEQSQNLQINKGKKLFHSSLNLYAHVILHV